MQDTLVSSRLDMENRVFDEGVSVSALRETIGTDSSVLLTVFFDEQRKSPREALASFGIRLLDSNGSAIVDMSIALEREVSLGTNRFAARPTGNGVLPGRQSGMTQLGGFVRFDNLSLGSYLIDCP
ncbi:MAG: hypothetical protein ACI841_000777 [Planctomycetota bacterium]|jgi:hypothetical protein